MKGRGWRISLLGGLRVTVNGNARLALPTRKSAALLAYLAIRPGEPHARSKLAALLWGDSDDEGARHSLRQALTHLRRALGPAAARALIVDSHTATLDPSAAQVDVVAFERFAGDGTPSALARAAKLYRGDLLEGFDLDESPWEEWLRSERTRLRELAIRALDRLLVHQRRVGATGDAIQTAARLLSLDALREPVHRALIELYMAEGRRGSALAQYQICVDILRRELGLEPDRETRRLYEDIVRRPAIAPPVSRRAARPPALAARRGPSAPDAIALVGRQAEVTCLRDALDAAERRRGRLIVVSGEGGIGKSRLVDEFMTEGRRRGHRTLVGRAYETTRRLTLGPWLEALRGDGSTLPREAMASLGTPWRVELARLFSEPEGESASVPDTLSEPGRLAEAICRLVVELSHARPLILVLEDLHWADEMTLQLVTFVARRIGAVRVLLVATVREEELADAPLARRMLEELERQGNTSRVPLVPLSRDATVELVRKLVRADPAEIDRAAQQIWRLSEGNPFVVVEAARDRDHGASDDTSRPMPVRVREMIAARLARLSDAARHIVAIGAVIGHEFDFEVIERAAGLTPAEAVGALEELVRRRVFHAVGERFDFIHDRVRDGAFQQLLRPRRKVLHATVARAFEKVHAGGRPVPAATLGHHYLEAEIWDRAALHLREAGRQAIRCSAFHDAARCLQEAAGALGRLPESPETVATALDTQVDLWSVAIGFGDYRASAARADELGRLIHRVGDPLRRGWAFRALAYQTRITSGPYRSLDLGLEALNLARESGDDEFRAAAALEVGRALLQLGSYRQAVDLLRSNIRSLRGERLDLRSAASVTAVTSRVWVVLALVSLGEFSAAFALGEEALEIADRLAHTPSRCGALVALGTAHCWKGDVDRAIACLEDAREIASAPDGPGMYLVPVMTRLGLAYTLAGRITEAVQELQECVARSRASGDRQGLAELWLGEAQLAAGHPEEARRWIEEAARMARERHARGHEAWCLRAQGELATRDGDAGEAETRYREAIELAAELEMRPVEALARRGLGTILADSGRGEEARTELSRADHELAVMGMVFWLRRARKMSTA